MRLRLRLALSHGVIIGLMCLVFPLALYAIHRLSTRIDALLTGNNQAGAALDRIRDQLGSEVSGLLRQQMMPPDINPPAVDNTPTPMRGNIDAARALFATPAEREALDDFAQRYVHWRNAIAIWQAGRMAQPGAVELPAGFDALRESITRLRRIKHDELQAQAVATRNFAEAFVVLVGVLAALAFLFGLLTTLRLVRSITRSADRLTVLVKRMSDGDFEIVYADSAIDEFDALGRHFESMGQALRLFHSTNLERIVAEQRRTTAVLDSIGDGLVIFSDEARIERINPVAERQLGLEHNQAEGKQFEQIGDADVGARVREVLDTGTVAADDATEIRIERDGEQRILAYWLNRFVEGESGRPGVVMVMRDVSSQREFDKIRDEFVLRVSHELRTPMTSIRMGLGLLGEKLQFAQGSRDAELYQTILQELTRMIALLGDLLDLSRLRAGAQGLERTPTEIDALLGQARQRFELLAQEAGVALETEIEAGLPRLLLCRSEMDRVLDNLIGNALRHTPPGGSVTLSAQRTADLRVAIAVVDTGEGIAFGQQALIFQPFVQVGNKRGGAGLGLTICKEIVQQHGGEIRVSSLPRRGTTIKILFPV
jgi:NtrC-family two-component system sensor histidine kinase KinB